MSQQQSASQLGAYVRTFFPFYDLLLSQVNLTDEKNVQLTDQEIKNLIVKISSLDKTGREMIYICIRVHSLRNSDSKLLDIPYGGENIDSKMQENDTLSNIKFDLRQFPCILNRMLQRFADLHCRKMEEDRIKVLNSSGVSPPDPLL